MTLSKPASRTSFAPGAEASVTVWPSNAGNVLGSRASLMVDAHMLMILFSVLLMAVGVFMVRKSCRMSQVGDAGTVAQAVLDRIPHAHEIGRAHV